MKKLHFPLSRLLLLSLVAGLATVAMAQTNGLPPIPPGMTYTADGAMVPEGGGGFQPDDSGPPGPPGGGGAPVYGSWGCTNCTNVDYGTNLYLTITLASNQQTVTVTLVNTKTNNVNYLLLVSSNLAGPWITNQSLLATSSVTVAAPIWTYGFEGLFFWAKEGMAPAPGSVKWMTSIPVSGQDAFGSGLDSSPAVSGATGQILVTIANYSVPVNYLFALDPIYGQIQWADNIFSNYNSGISYQEGEMTGSAAVSSNGTIYVGSLDGYLYSINPDGTTNWQRHAGNVDSVYSTPAIGSNGIIYVTSDEAELAHAGTNVITGVTSFYTNGSTNWFFQPQDLYYGNFGDVDSSPVVGADGSIYFLAEGSRLYSLTAVGQLKWFLTLPGDGEPASTPALAADGTIVVGSGIENVQYGTQVPTPYLYDVNPDGSLNWVFNVSTYGGYYPVQTSPTIDQNGLVYTGSATSDPFKLGCLFAVNPNGATNWVFANSEGFTISSPALAADGTAYIGDYGDMYGVKDGSDSWQDSPDGSIIGNPAIMPDGSVLFTTEGGSVYCLWGSAPIQDSVWPMFQQNMSHTGQQPPIAYTNSISYSGAPFVFNGFYTGTEFGFSMTGPLGSSNWCVYASTNLAATNWTLLTSNLTMNATNGNNSFTDSSLGGASQKFYVVSRSNVISQTIGFYNQTIAHGTNLVADQLYQVDDNILNASYNDNYVYPMNTLVSLFAISNAWSSAESGTKIYKWNGTGFTSATNTSLSGPNWPSNADMTLVPGNSFLMVNTNSSAFTTTFMGLVRGEQIFHVGPETNGSPSTNYLSATVPAAGYITNVTEYRPHNGDTIKLWNTTSNAYVSYPYSGTNWTAGTPQLAVGQGFLLITTNAETWTNSWQ